MRLEQWLDARTPAPPPALRQRIDAALRHELRGESADLCDTCLGAAEGLVRALLGENATSRDSALDLLAADALVTYAFEAASEQPGGLARRASAAMVRLAALGLDESRGVAVRA